MMYDNIQDYLDSKKDENTCVKYCRLTFFFISLFINSKGVTYELGTRSHSNAIVVNIIEFSHFVQFTFVLR